MAEEVDIGVDVGAPAYMTWPPFPDTTSITLIPFNEFVPKGLLVSPDGRVEDERDGYGAPTVSLRVSHDATSSKKKRKKKAKRKGPDGEEVLVSLKWYEEWQETEDAMQPVKIDINANVLDRYQQVMADFHLSHSINPALQSLFDNFRIYTGLLGTLIKAKRDDGSDVEADEGEEDDKDEYQLDPAQILDHQPLQALTSDPTTRSLITADNPWPEEIYGKPTDEPFDFGGAELDKNELAKRIRMDTFLKNPERGTKIFLSSYFHDRGLIWSDQKLFEAPLMLSFILRSLLRSEAFPSLSDSLTAAIHIAELAKIELPMTKKMACALPDGWNAACMALWKPAIFEDYMNVGLVGGVEEEEQEEGGIRKAILDPLQEAELDKRLADALDPNTLLSPTDLTRDAIDSEDVNGKLWKPTLPTLPPPPPEGDDFTHQPDIINGGWDSQEPSSSSIVPAGDEPNGWDPPSTEAELDAIWSTPTTSQPTILTFLGPSTLPLTHAPMEEAESSVRYVKEIVRPGGGANDGGLGERFSVLKMAPWKAPRKGERSLVPPPSSAQIKKLGTSLNQFAPSNNKVHNMKQNVIDVYVEKETLENVSVGMGIRGVWVRVGSLLGDSENKDVERGEGGKESGWWFIHSVDQVLPSYWTEP